MSNVNYEEEMRSALVTFVVEGRELLDDMESALLRLEVEAAPETINELFRVAHTMKGTAGLFGLEHLGAFTHVMESVMERVRSGEIGVSSALIGALLPCHDHLSGLLEAVAAGVYEPTPEQAELAATLLAQLTPYLDGDGPADEPSATAEEIAREAGPAGRNVHVSLRFGPESLRNGMDPLSFIRYLSTLGDIVTLRCLPDFLPDANAMDPEVCYLAFEVTLLTASGREAVEEVFEFVRDDADIWVLPEGSDAADYARLIDSFGAYGGLVEEVLVSTAAVTPADLAQARQHGRSVQDAPKGPADGAEQSAEQSAEESADPASTARPANLPRAPREGAAARNPEAAADRIALPEAARTAQAAGASRAPAQNRSSEASSIRIDSGRLDRLIDVVGELVIAGAAAGVRAEVSRDEELAGALSEVMRLVEEVRDSALQLRMVPIGTTFSRFQRVVRDVGGVLGKQVDLVISGGDTEVDKALVEQIADPLTHLVRNAMDHGIETADVRQESGKTARGTLRLNAFHDSGSIVIEVCDDGAGIDCDRVLSKAKRKGLIDPGATLTRQETHALLFEPGFSTSEQVSDLSGRGVGLDVVRRNVAALRGTVEVDSTPGEGTTMRIRLPLTLAIIDGFLVGVGEASYVIPLDRVVECVALPTLPAARDCMDLRGEVLPLIRLRSRFSIEGQPPIRENVVVVDAAGLKVGLVVDALMGEFQTVIKPLGKLFEHVRGIGGSTILGNGEVALIIDVSVLVSHHAETQLARV